ncbi:hypothetical protein L9F63_018749, partial [Diploptera punctata]
FSTLVQPLIRRLWFKQGRLLSESECSNIVKLRMRKNRCRTQSLAKHRGTTSLKTTANSPEIFCKIIIDERLK